MNGIDTQELASMMQVLITEVRSLKQLIEQQLNPSVYYSPPVASLQEILDRMPGLLRNERRLSESTCRAYRADLTAFLDFIQERDDNGFKSDECL